MKRIITLTLCLSLLLAMLSLSGCGKDPIVGTWEGKIDIGQQMNISNADNFPSIDLRSFEGIYIDYSLEFKDDGTYKVDVNEDSVDKAKDELVEEFKKIVPELIEMMIGMSIEEYIVSSGIDVTVDEFLEKATSDELINDAMTFDFSDDLEGIYRIEGDVMYLSYELEGKEYKDVSQNFELDKDTLYFENFLFSEDIQSSDEDTPSMPCTFTRKK